MENVKLLGSEIVSKHLTWAKLLRSVECALREYSSEPSKHPSRIALWTQKNRRTFVMPAFSANENVLSTKILNVHPDCAERTLRVRNSYLFYFDTENGTLKGVMESEPISTMRTAATSAVSTKALLRRQPDVLGVLGTGDQAAQHILSLSFVYNFKKIKVWSRNPDNVIKLCNRLKGINLTCCQSAEEAVSDADVVVTATSSSVSVLKGQWLKDGCHINCIGAVKPNWRELDDDIMRDSVLYVDGRITAEQESGDIIMTKSKIYAEIGEVLLGRKTPKYSKFTLFKSVGLAIGDAYAAKLVWDGVCSG